MQRFRAIAAERSGDDVVVSNREWSTDDLMPGDVTIRVEHSSVNYKDGLAARADGRVVRAYPLILGIDLAGTVIESSDARYPAGSGVIAHGYDIGVSHHGGFAEVARIPGDWVVPLPAGLSTRQAMVVGTAGFTAALSVDRLEHMGLRPGQGPVVVTGASGGVGSTAVDILAARGYDVVASTGTADAHEMLRALGASQVIDRSELSTPSRRPLESARWAGAVDPVGGDTLATLLQTTRPFCSVACSGLTGGFALNTTVMPFILRGVSLLGIESVTLPIERRIALWNRIATDLRPPHLDDVIGHEIDLGNVPEALGRIHRGEVNGRIVVRI